MGNEASNDWAKTYTEIKNKHDQAFKTIEQAIKLEEQERPQEAIQKYREGIKLIDETLSIPVECPDSPDDTWTKGFEMIQKIKRTKTEVMIRIDCIESTPGSVVTFHDQPPSYEEAISSDSSLSSMSTYHNLSSTVREMTVNLDEELVYIDGVRLYFISPQGEVLSTKKPQLLRVSLVEGTNGIKAILRLGDWIYPLIQGVSLYYRTDYGAFILPDVYSDTPGSSIGIILPSDADDDVFDLLDNILHQLITVKTDQELLEEKSRVEDTSTRISNKIINGAMYISQGLVIGAQKAEDFLNRGTPVLISNMPRNRRPTEVPGGVSTGVKMAEGATSSAMKVSGYIVEKIGEGASKLGHFLAPHIEKQGTKLLVKSFSISETEASDKMKNILTIAGGAAEGFSTICRGLETSGGILSKSLKENTVKIVAHKYGSSAAATTEDSLNTVGNVYTTFQNAKIFRPTRLARTTVGQGIQHYSPTSTGNRVLLERLESESSRIQEVEEQPATASGIEKCEKKCGESQADK